MAVSIVMTGTGRNCTLTNGTSVITSANMAGIVVGATVQGTGIPTGTRVGQISGSNISLVNASGVPVNVTANGVQSMIFSSVWGSILTVNLTASGDTATMQNIYNAGFGVMSDNLGQRHIFFPGAFGIEWRNIVAGALFDFQNWTMEFGALGYWAWDQATILGELRGGYLQNGTQFIRSSGPTFISRDFKNSTAGGSNMFIGTATGTVTGTFRMNDLRVVAQGGNNRCPQFNTGRMNCIVDGMILDYQGDGGPNAGIGASFGTLNNTTIVRANSGIGAPNGTNFATINGLAYSGLFSDTPQHKFAIPNNYILEGYAPQVLSTQFLGGFQDNTTETFANIDLSTAGWGLTDLITRYQRFGGPNEIRFPRRVSLQFNDSTGADLTGVTLFIRSGATTLVNAVQAGDYSANTQALVLNWTANVGSYRTANTTTNTISQVAQIRRYGFIEQSTSYSLNLASYSQPFFMLTDTSLSGISESTASAITTAGINWTTRTITPTADLTYDQINARIAWELAQTTNSAQADPRTINGTKVSLATGWTLVVNTGRTISAGNNIKEWFTPTITINGTGKIDAVYQTTVGTSTIWEFGSVSEPIIAGTSLAIYDASGTTRYYNAVTSNGVYRFYIPPQSTGVTYTYAIERYGYRREEGTFPSNAGGILFYVPNYSEDVGITQTNRTTVNAYTTLSDTAQIYDATANFRLSETGIKLGQLVARDGTFLDFGNFNVKFKDDNASIVSVASGTITYKSIVINESTKYNAMKATPPKTITPNDTEQINVLIEDANGDSQVKVEGGSGTYQIWKLPNSTPNIDFQTGTLLTTTTNLTYRFIGEDGYKLFLYDTGTLYGDSVSKSKGTYKVALFFGPQVQLAQSAEVTLINQIVNELKLKLDTNLDAKVSTRLADADYIDPATPEQIWDYTTRTLTSAGSSGATLAEIEASTILAKEATSQQIKTKVDTLENYNDATTQTKLDALQTTADNLPTLAEMEASTVLANKTDVTDAKNEIIAEVQNIDVDLTGVALQATSQEINGKVDEIKTKVLTLENYNDATAQSKLDAIKAKTDVLENTDLTGIATTQNVTDAQTAIETKIDNIVVDNEAIANEVWNQEPERLKQVATVETTGEQLASFNNA